MKHRMHHSHDLRARLPDYARDLGVTLAELTAAYDWMLANDVLFDEPCKEGVATSISVIRCQKKLGNALASRFFVRLYQDLPVRYAPIPAFGINWDTLSDRWLRMWEQLYNMVINKIPVHAIRLAWLRLGGARIGRGSSVWRNTEVLGIEHLRIGKDSVVGWHCQLDARSGLVIGDHVCIASHVLIIAGSHDVAAAEFWAIAAPIYIEDYAWIASRALLAHGSHIGRGAVVTANTVINKAVAPYKIVGGSGAKPIGERPHDLNYTVGGKSLFTLFH